MRNEIHANQFLFYLSLLIERNEGFIYSTLFREGMKQKKIFRKKERKAQNRKKRSESIGGRMFKKKKGDNG